MLGTVLSAQTSLAHGPLERKQPQSGACPWISASLLCTCQDFTRTSIFCSKEDLKCVYECVCARRLLRCLHAHAHLVSGIFTDDEIPRNQHQGCFWEPLPVCGGLAKVTMSSLECLLLCLRGEGILCSLPLGESMQTEPHPPPHPLSPSRPASQANRKCRGMNTRVAQAFGASSRAMQVLYQKLGFTRSVCDTLHGGGRSTHLGAISRGWSGILRFLFCWPSCHPNPGASLS